MNNLSEALCCKKVQKNYKMPGLSKRKSFYSIVLGITATYKSFFYIIASTAPTY